jgi:hypothetical protein
MSVKIYPIANRNVRSNLVLCINSCNHSRKWSTAAMTHMKRITLFCDRFNGSQLPRRVNDSFAILLYYIRINFYVALMHRCKYFVPLGPTWL